MNNKKINTEIEDIVLNYVRVVCNQYKVEAIILFGSYAKGTENEDSDIDYRIEPHIIRIQDYKDLSTPFVQEVVNTGIKVA